MFLNLNFSSFENKMQPNILDQNLGLLRGKQTFLNLNFSSFKNKSRPDILDQWRGEQCTNSAFLNFCLDFRALIKLFKLMFGLPPVRPVRPVWPFCAGNKCF